MTTFSPGAGVGGTVGGVSFVVGVGGTITSDDVGKTYTYSVGVAVGPNNPPTPLSKLGFCALINAKTPTATTSSATTAPIRIGTRELRDGDLGGRRVLILAIGWGPLISGISVRILSAARLVRSSRSCSLCSSISALALVVGLLNSVSSSRITSAWSALLIESALTRSESRDNGESGTFGSAGNGSGSGRSGGRLVRVTAKAIACREFRWR